MQHPEQQTPVSNIAVRKLKDGKTLRTGKIYSVIDENRQLADTLLWHTVVDACNARQTVTVVLADGVEPPLSSLSIGPDIRRYIAAGQLRVLIADPVRVHSDKDSIHIGNDLRRSGADACGLLVISGADRLLGDRDDSFFSGWQAWAIAHHACVLMLFRQFGSQGGNLLTRLLPSSDLLAGLSCLTYRYGTVNWETLHWFDAGGLVAGRAMPLQIGVDGCLEVAANEGESFTKVPAADELDVVVERAAVLQNEKLPDGWRRTEHDDSVVAALRAGDSAATVVLVYGPAIVFQHLLRRVYELRVLAGPRLKIVIREINFRLRHSQEALLARFGATLIVPAEVSYARFLGLVSQVQGQVFPHVLPDSLDEALRQAMPEESGYLPPARFIAAARRLLDRSRIAHVQCTLLRLRLVSGLMPVDALRYCEIRRAGDICTADVAHVYLLLFGCRENDVGRAVDRLFGLPVGELFGTEDRFLSANAIGEAIDALEVLHRRHAFSDLTEALAAVRLPARHGAAIADATTGGPRHGESARFPAPRPAQRRPLPVKGAPGLIDLSTVE